MSKSQNLYALIFLTALGTMPLIAFAAPRFMAYGPGIIGLVACCAYPYIFKARPVFYKPVFIAIGILLALAAASAFWSVDSGVSLERVGKMALVLLPGGMLVSAALLVPAEALQKYFSRYALFTLAAGVLIYIEMFLNYPFYKITRDVPFHMGPESFNMNRSVSVILALAMPLCAMMIGGKRYGLAAAFFVMLLLIMTKTESQSSMVGLSLATLVWLAFPVGSKYGWGAFAFVLCAGTLVAPFICNALFSMAPEINASKLLGEEGGYGGQRLEIWDFVSRYALQSPLFGHGIESTKVVTFETEGLFYGSNTVLHPHNFAVQLWMEFGVIGALLAGAFFVWIARLVYGLPDKGDRKMALTAFMVLLTVATFAYGLWQSWWLGLVMLVAAHLILLARARAAGVFEPA